MENIGKRPTLKEVGLRCGLLAVLAGGVLVVTRDHKDQPLPQAAYAENNGLMADINCHPDGLLLGFVGPVDQRIKEYRIENESKPAVKAALMHVDSPGNPIGRGFFNKVESLDGMVVELKGGYRYRITMNEFPSGQTAASVVLKAPICRVNK